MERMNDYKKEFDLACEKIVSLEEKNKTLKEERDNCLKEVKLCYNDIHSLEGQISDLEKENKILKETLQHRDSVLSIMYDLLRSDLSDYEQLSMIDVVIDVEVGNDPQNKLREELLDRFWKRNF